MLNKIALPTLNAVSGQLDVDLEIVPGLKGAFKTAHPGSISSIPSNNILPPSLTGKICVKQLYFSTGGAIRRYNITEARSYILSEVACLDWARILLDLTYQFIEAFEEDQGVFPGVIPRLQFIEAAIAEVSGEEKIFLIEEWINTSKATFTKYINNARAVPCIPQTAPEELKNIANFLCFAQHVQYQFTFGRMFTSDYQGMSHIIIG